MQAIGEGGSSVACTAACLVAITGLAVCIYGVALSVNDAIKERNEKPVKLSQGDGGGTREEGSSVACAIAGSATFTGLLIYIYGAIKERNEKFVKLNQGDDGGIREGGSSVACAIAGSVTTTGLALCIYGAIKATRDA